jgi:hypothetical protein
MAINKLMRLALKALSYPDIDMKKVNPLERTVKEHSNRRICSNALPALGSQGDLRPAGKSWCGFMNPKQPPRHTLLFFHGGGGSAKAWIPTTASV